MQHHTKIFVTLVLNIMLFCMVPAGWIYAQEKDKVLIYQYDLTKEIAPTAWHNTRLAFSKAREISADLVLIRMNTYGGLLESADSIRTRILQSEIPVFVFINHNAASAGALIAIACDSIYMTTGSTIGAATVVNQTGEAVPDKYQSYMRAMMRATAEATGRDQDIAQAMVDPRIRIEGVIDSGSVLTFTASEALKHGFCEGIVSSTAELLQLAGISDYEIITQKLKPLDRIIGFLVSPVVSGILIMIIVGGIYFELQTPGIGFPLVASITAALLYFAPLYLHGLADHWEILLFVVGVILIVLEIFAIPGFGVAGISGIVLVVTGLTLSLINNVGLDFSRVNFMAAIASLFLVIISIFLAILGSYYLTRTMFTRNRLFGSLALEAVESASEGYTSAEVSYQNVVGQRGIAHSMLRPAGKVRIGDDVYDATALTGYIDKGEPVKVVRYETSQLFVVKDED